MTTRQRIALAAGAAAVVTFIFWLSGWNFERGEIAVWCGIIAAVLGTIVFTATQK